MHSFGGGGNDIMTGGAGDDLVQGGAGLDTVDYSADTAGVVVDLVHNTATGAGNRKRWMFSMENVIGGSSIDTH